MSTAALPQRKDKLRLAVHKFASCDGCQLQLLSLEDEMLQIAEQVDIAYFLEASSNARPGPYDVSLVEGSITTEHDAQRIKAIRAESSLLITIGACATAGGIQALKNFGNKQDFLNAVYAHPEFIETLSTSTAIGDHVAVDFELRGCPINRYQLLEVIRAAVQGQLPRIPNYSVCIECKRRGTVCIAVAKNQTCLGPVTHAGCNAICPSYSRSCYGCFGPSIQANCSSLLSHYLPRSNAEQLLFQISNFNASAPEFRDAAAGLRL